MARDVLVIAAHPDDEVLGAGGTIARMSSEGFAVHVLIFAEGITSRDQVRDPLACAGEIAELVSASRQANDLLGVASLEFLGFPDNRMDSVDRLDLTKHVEKAIAQYAPATVLTHNANDVNIDHRVLHDAVIAACRPVPGHCVRELLFFEIPSSSEWRPPDSRPAFAPNWYVDISSTLTQKLAALQAYASELRDFPHPRSLMAIEALARWRGASVGVEAAEAFVLGRATK